MDNLITRNRGIVDDLFRVLDGGFTDYAEYTPKNLHVVTDEDEGNYYIKAEMPGINDERVDISYENDILSISADYEEQGVNSLRRGKYSWACTVRDIDHESIKANLNDGILNIILPKSEKVKPRKIQIEKG